MVLSFFFPAELIQLVAGPEEAKNLAGKCPPPDSDPFSDGRVCKKSGQLVKTIRSKGESPIQVPQTQSAFHPRAQQNAFRRRDVR